MSDGSMNASTEMKESRIYVYSTELGLTSENWIIGKQCHANCKTIISYSHSQRFQDRSALPTKIKTM